MRSLWVLFLVAASSARATPSLEAQWLVRGSQSLDLIKKLGPEGHPSKIKDPVQRLEVMLEGAYALHAARPDLVHVASANGGDEFHLGIVTNSGQTFSLAYLYKEDGSLVGARLESLPKDWTILFSPASMQAGLVKLMERRRTLQVSDGLAPPRPLLVSTREGMLVFDLEDPLHAFVYERELNIPPPPDAAGPDAPPKAAPKAKSPAAGTAAPAKKSP